MQWSTFAKYLAKFTQQEIARIKRAFLMAKNAHADQKRKSGEPYFIHPIAIAKTLIDLGADCDTVTAALLHDCPEDTNVTLDQIEKEFGHTVSLLVDGVTKILPTQIEHTPNLNSRIETIRKMMVLMEQDIRIMVIKLADRLHNMQTVEFMSEEKQKKYATETLSIYVPIADRLCMQDMRDALANASIAVLYPEHTPEITTLNSEYNNLCKKTAPKLQQSIIQQQLYSTPIVTVEARSSVKWLKHIEEEKHAITSIAVICECVNINECYTLLGQLHQIYKREQLSFQDYINSPASNGYQGLHTTIINEQGLRIRCKIRTKTMNLYAQKGITIYCFDNKAQGVQQYLPWTKQIDNLDSETQGVSEDFWDTLQRDILGESIIIHGEDDQVISIPVDVCVLDALFYLYGEDALYATDAFADGKLVFFWQPVRNGMRLTMDSANGKTVNVDWLRIVKTSTASAAIRAALKLQQRAKKITIGKTLLQAELTLHNRGHLAEYSHRNSNDQYTVNDALFINIAEGTVTAEEVYDACFSTLRRLKKFDNRPISTVLQIISTDDGANEQTLLTQLLPHEIDIEEYSYKKHAHGFTASLRITANAEQLHNAETTLLMLKNTVVRNVTGTFWFGLTTCILIALWTADVLLAKWYLVPKFTFVDITVSRFIVLFIFALLLLISQRVLYKQKISLKRISLLDRKLVSSSIALFSTGLCTYVALKEITSIEYAALINLATILAFATLVKKYSIDALLLAVISVCTLTAIGLYSQASNIYIIAGITAAVSFLSYSYFTKRYQTEQNILLRYPHFLLAMSIGTLIASAFLLPISTITTLSASQIATLILYHLVFTSIPYALYFQFAKRKHLESVGNLIPFFFPLVLVIESAVHTNQTHWLYVIVFVATVIWTYRRLHTANESH